MSLLVFVVIQLSKNFLSRLIVSAMSSVSFFIAAFTVLRLKHRHGQKLLMSSSNSCCCSISSLSVIESCTVAAAS